MDTYTTHDGHKLTVNEEKFITLFIETGNGRQSYIQAYGVDVPNIDTPEGKEANKKLLTYAANEANKLKKKPHIASEIKFRLNKIQSNGIASAEEIMQYFTGVMRGEIKDQFGLDAPLGERTKAAQELAKRQIDMVGKSTQSGDSAEVKIVLDWTRPEPVQVASVQVPINTDTEDTETDGE